MDYSNNKKNLSSCSTSNDMGNNKIKDFELCQNRFNIRSKQVEKIFIIKANKLFRPWVTCRCLDCNMNIDSEKLVYVMKMALSNSNNSNNNNDKRVLFRRDSIEDSSDNRSEANSTTTERTIVYNS